MLYFWLFSIKTEILNLKISYLVYLFSIFISFLFIKYYFYFFKTSFKPKFDQVNSTIKVNFVLCVSTRYLHYTWFYIFVIVSSVL